MQLGSFLMYQLASMNMNRYSLLILVFASITANSEVIINTEYEYYAVSSRSKDDFLYNINKATPIKGEGVHYHGSASYDIEWRYWWHTVNGLCRIRDVKVSADIVITLPDLKSSDKEVLEIWEVWYPKLVNHENNHKHLAIEYVGRIEEEIYKLPGYRSCRALQKRVDYIGKTNLQKLDKENKSYDKNTQHGETEGAALESYL